jgi:hypothetical protein
MSSLQPGIRVVYRLHFHNARPWADRLRLNSGLVSKGEQFVCRDDWRQPTDTELALLITGEGPQPDEIAVFNIPERLRTRWWDIAAGEQANGLQMSLAGFQEYAKEVVEFLHFKKLPLPPSCALDVLISAPGQSSTSLYAGGIAGTKHVPGPLGSINLGDEECALDFFNLDERQLAEHLPTFGFVAEDCDYPITRLNLSPCEGFWLAGNPFVLGGDTRGRNEVDVQLVIRRG